MGLNRYILDRQQISIMQFTKSVAYLRTIISNTHIHKLNSKFIYSIGTSNLLIATIEWTKVFGNDREKTHWKSNLTNEQINNFRSVLHNISGNKNTWHNTWDSMVKFRNKIVAHTDLDLTGVRVPSFDLPRIVAAGYLGWLEPFARTQGYNIKPFNLDTYYAIAVKDCSGILEKLSPHSLPQNNRANAFQDPLA